MGHVVVIRRVPSVHEWIAGGPLPKDLFWRGMEPRLEPVGRMSSGLVGKPARLRRHLR